MEKKFIIQRIKSLIIDLLFISLILFFVSSFINLEKLQISKLNLLNREIVIKLNLFYIILFSYYILIDVFNRGISLGKKVIEIKIVSYKNKKLSILSNIIRTLLKFLFVFSFLLPFTIIYYLYYDIVIYDKLLKTKIDYIK